MDRPGPQATLLLVDIQQGFDHPSWGRRNNPAFAANVRALLAAWRAAGRPVVHVRHDSLEPASTLRPGQPGNDFRPEARPAPGEPVVPKHVTNAFVGTGLEAVLQDLGSRELVVCGIQTNHCVATTARMAANLGYRTWVAADACATVGQTDRQGRAWTAEELHEVALMELDGLARVLDTKDLVPLATA
jgi:nicotinamidase-related amidase